MASTSELLDRFVELFNNSRFQEAEQDYAPAASIEEIGPNRRFTPREATENARAWKRHFSMRAAPSQAKLWTGTKVRPKSCGAATTAAH